MGVELDRSPGKDEHRLEDALARVGAEADTHRGYLDAMLVTSQSGSSPASARPQLLVKRIDALPDPERAFVHIYGGSDNAFWLDSSAEGERGRFSFIGDAGGPLGAVVTYDVTEGGCGCEGRGGVEERRRIDLRLSRARAAAPRWPPPADLPFDFDCGLAGYLGYELKAECERKRRPQLTAPRRRLRPGRTA